MGTVPSLICGDVENMPTPTPEIQDLSKEDINMILRTWKVPSQKLIDTGEMILLKFLEKNPPSQLKFYAFKNIPLIQLRGAPGFRTHASRVMNEFSSSIDCLDKANGLAAIAVSWTEVGRSHFRRKITRFEFLVGKTLEIGLLKKFF